MYSKCPDSVWNMTGVSETPGKVLPWAPSQDSVGQPPTAPSHHQLPGTAAGSAEGASRVPEAWTALPDAPGSNCCPSEHSPGGCAAGGSGSPWPASHSCQPSDCVGCRTRSEMKTPVTFYQNTDHCPQAPALHYISLALQLEEIFDDDRTGWGGGGKKRSEHSFQLCWHSKVINIHELWKNSYSTKSQIW